MTKPYKYRERSGETGSDVEERLFYANNDPRLEVLRRIKFDQIQHRSLFESIAEVVNGQTPGGYVDGGKLKETIDPPSQWARDVYNRLADRLQLEDYDNLRFYPCLKTSADAYHGIDFFILYTDPESGREVMVTVDVSKNKKKHEYKADVIVSPWGVVLSSRFPFMWGKEIADLERSTEEEDQEIEKQRREAVAEAIARMIQKKLDTPSCDSYANIVSRLTRARLETVLGGSR